MRFQRFGLLAGIAAIGVVTGSVRADTTFFNQPLDAGFAVGTGIPNTNFVGARSTSGLEREVGLGSLLRFTGPTIVPTASANPAIAGVFGNLPPGVSPFPPSPSPFQLAIWNINYSFYAAGGILGDTITLTLTGLDSVPHPFTTVVTNTTPNLKGTTAVQDSTNLGFFGLPLSSFDPSREGRYFVNLTLSDVASATTLTTTAEFDVVPEPSTVVMGLMAGLAGGGYCWRKRRRTLAKV